MSVSQFLTSIRRYYSNAFTDRLKQDAMNLFLGYFVPKENETPLWELDNDYYLHNFHVQAGSSTSTMFFQKNLGVDEDDLDDSNRGREDANVKRKNVKVSRVYWISKYTPLPLPTYITQF